MCPAGCRLTERRGPSLSSSSTSSSSHKKTSGPTLMQQWGPDTHQSMRKGAGIPERSGRRPSEGTGWTDINTSISSDCSCVLASEKYSRCFYSVYESALVDNWCLVLLYRFYIDTLLSTEVFILNSRFTINY